MKQKFNWIWCFVLLFTALSLQAADLKEGDLAPTFKIKDQKGQEFDLQDRKVKAQWTVLYFYPAAETPGCTKQACAFRDGIEKIRKLNADVIGVSINSVEDQAGFAKHHNLNFTLLADEDATVTKLYGSKMPILKMSKRWTFILDPQLKIRAINRDVDPVKDATQVAEKIESLQKSPVN